MNFLLHYCLAKRDLGNVRAGVGAMLPDLWRMADRRVRARHVRPASEACEVSETGALSELLSGIEHHHEADRWFHAAPHFAAGERATAMHLREASFDAPRITLFAHITWELCIDGAFVRARGLDPVLAELREAFAVAEEERAMDDAASLHHFAHSERSEHERNTFDARMRRICEEIVRGPWIEGYAHGHGLAERIDAIRARVGFPPMSARDRARFAEVAEALLVRASESLRVIEKTPSLLRVLADAQTFSE